MASKKKKEKEKCNYYYCDNFGETSGYISHMTYHDAKAQRYYKSHPQHLPRVIIQCFRQYDI